MQQGVARSTEPGVTRSIQPALLLLEKTPILLETMLRDLPEDLLRWKPSPERWSIAEVLGHLADLEMVYADRTRRIVTEDTPTLQKYDPTGTVVIGDYVRGSASETDVAGNVAHGVVLLQQRRRRLGSWRVRL